jgi:oxaloacetate decarboxylase beta subunit
MELNVLEAIKGLWYGTGIMMIDPKQIIMIVISLILIYLAIVKKFEPLLLLPIAFGMLIVNLPAAAGSGLMEGSTSIIRPIKDASELVSGELLWKIKEGG